MAEITCVVCPSMCFRRKTSPPAAVRKHHDGRDNHNSAGRPRTRLALHEAFVVGYKHQNGEEEEVPSTIAASYV